MFLCFIHSMDLLRAGAGDLKGFEKEKSKARFSLKFH